MDTSKMGTIASLDAVGGNACKATVETRVPIPEEFWRKIPEEFWRKKLAEWLKVHQK